MMVKEIKVADDDSNNNTLQGFTRLLAQAKTNFSSRSKAHSDVSNNYFKSAEWSPDGTCIVTNSADNHIRTFVIPPTLLDTKDEPIELNAYSAISSFEPVNTVVCYPGYDLQDPTTTLILSTANEHPICLHSSLTGKLVASYPLVDSNTEAYIKPQSLLFSIDGARFVAGSDASLSIFDVSRPGASPVISFKTGPKNNRSFWSNPSTSVRGLISALHVDVLYNVLAIGTLTRQIGLYDAAGTGECIGAFSVSGTEADKQIFGGGVTQVQWSECGRYLHITERKSDGVMVYDIRNTGQLLSWVVGRNAMTNQRMKVELAPDREHGQQGLWAGGVDGTLRHWEAPHLSAGPIKPFSQRKLHEGKSPICSEPFHADENRSS